MVFQALATFVLIALSANRQLRRAELSPLSLQSLVMRAEAGSPWVAWGSSITLITFWSIGLLAIGIMRWTFASAVKAMVIAAAPSVLIFGIWALVIA